MSVTKFVQETEAQLRQIVADGTASFKIFLAYKISSAWMMAKCIRRWNWRNVSA